MITTFNRNKASDTAIRWLPDIDSAEFSEEIINSFGNEEWQLGLLTYRLHGHWGIYSLLGVKMGLHARELSLFSGPIEQVISSAGNRPPVSCMNDGLQVSTGATLGNGKIKITEAPWLVKAKFHFRHHSFTLALKAPMQRKLSKDLQKLRATNQENNYWKAIEHLSKMYWLHWNRKSIFELVI